MAAENQHLVPDSEAAAGHAGVDSAGEEHEVAAVVVMVVVVTRTDHLQRGQRPVRGLLVIWVALGSADSDPSPSSQLAVAAAAALPSGGGGGIMSGCSWYTG